MTAIESAPPGSNTEALTDPETIAGEMGRAASAGPSRAML